MMGGNTRGRFSCVDKNLTFVAQGTVLRVDTSDPLCYTNQGDAICRDRHERKAKAEFIM